MNDATYAGAQAGITRFQARDRAEIGELGRSLALDHGRRTGRAVLLLHGMSASPGQFVAIARELYERGNNVFVPRLPRHGREDRMTPVLADMTAGQLKSCLRDSLQLVRGLGDAVTVAGFSLGGLLAAYAAQFESIDNVVAIAPYLGFSWLPSRFGERLARWALRKPNRFYWWDPWLRERQLPAHGYPRLSTHALAHGLNLAYELMAAAQAVPPVSRRLVIALNPREPAVNNRAALRLARAWQKHGAHVSVERLRNVPFAHDIIEPKRYPEIARRVRPQVIDLIDG